jgi:beta-lactam-binding protein with PASTA domain
MARATQFLLGYFGRTPVRAVALLAVVLGITACGGSGDTTTVEATSNQAEVEKLELEKEKVELETERAKAEAKQEQAAAKAEKAQVKNVKHEAAVESEPEPQPEEAPNVVGMRLPEARSTLSAAGYTTQAENTDTAFGIVIPSHYTICEQSDPHGSVITVLAQKYGC